MILRGDIYDLPFGPAFGKAGTTTTLVKAPQCRFRVDNIAAQDTGNPPGSATRIMQFLVGSRLQRPTASGATLDVFFALSSAKASAKAHGVVGPVPSEGFLRWDTADPSQQIAITVSFIQDSTFDACLFGRAIL